MCDKGANNGLVCIYSQSGEDYSRYANQIKCGKYNNLFSVNFSSWDNLSNPNLLTFFKIYYPKKDGNCALDTQ